MKDITLCALHVVLRQHLFYNCFSRDEGSEWKSRTRTYVQKNYEKKSRDFGRPLHELEKSPGNVDIEKTARHIPDMEDPSALKQNKGRVC